MGLFSNPEKEKRKAAEAKSRAVASRVMEEHTKNERARQKANAASSVAWSKAEASNEKSRVQREKIEADKIKALAKLSPEEREKFYKDIEEQKRREMELIEEQKRREIELKVKNETNLHSLEQSKAEGKLKLKRLELEEKYKMWEILPTYEKEKILKKRDEDDNIIKKNNSRNKKIVFAIWLLAALVVIVSIILTQIEVEKRGFYSITTEPILGGFTAYLISFFTLGVSFLATVGFKFNKKRELDQWEKMLSLEEPEVKESIV